MKKETELEYTGEVCPECGSRLVYKTGNMANLKLARIILNADTLRKIKDWPEKA